MALSAFDDRAAPPDRAVLHAVLGAAAPAWDRFVTEVAERHPPVDSVWAFAGAKFGWSMRLVQGKRILAYVTPCAGHFLVGIVLGQEATEAAHAAGLPETVGALLDASPRHAEGRGVRVPVRSDADVAACLTLVAAKTARKTRTRSAETTMTDANAPTGNGPRVRPRGYLAQMPPIQPKSKPQKKPKKSHRLVWIDCEMTGLDESTCVLVEIATIVTEEDLTIVAEGPDLVIHATEAELAAMPEVVREMHGKSGLTERVRKSNVTLAEAEVATYAFLRKHCRTKGIHILCGNSIGTDRRFLARYMPRVDRHLSYRMIDVSTVKELAKRWYPAEYEGRPEKKKGHRALADIRESIDELRYWRESVFKP